LLALCVRRRDYPSGGIAKMSEGITNPAVYAEHRAALGRAALSPAYPNVQALHVWRPDSGEYYRFWIKIPRREGFYIEFGPMEVAEVGQTDQSVGHRNRAKD